MKNLNFNKMYACPIHCSLKIAFNFGLPLLIALLHALFAALAFMKLLGNVSMSPIFIVMIIYTYRIKSFTNLVIL